MQSSCSFAVHLVQIKNHAYFCLLCRFVFCHPYCHHKQMWHPHACGLACSISKVMTLTLIPLYACADGTPWPCPVPWRPKDSPLSGGQTRQTYRDRGQGVQGRQKAHVWPSATVMQVSPLPQLT